ncbi:hypothetical protein PWT90_05468 [Aphanocladium album]|nr:hypothetical protein PWT90_05468 [Aphanocladium album]
MVRGDIQHQPQRESLKRLPEESKEHDRHKQALPQLRPPVKVATANSSAAAVNAGTGSPTKAQTSAATAPKSTAVSASPVKLRPGKSILKKTTKY